MSDLLNTTQFPPYQAGLTGRNNPKVKFDLKWAHEYLAEGQSVSFPLDITGGITDFGMMGNDEYGNCGSCGEVHIEMTTAARAGVAGPLPSSPLAVERYNAYDGNAPAPGPGVDLASYANWLFEQGLILGWAPVDLSNPLQAFALMAAADGLYIGVNLCDNNMAQFNNGQPFDLDGEEPNPQEGHCVVLSKAQSDSGPFEVITWGKSWPCTTAWMKACLFQNPNGEAFIMITTEEALSKFTPALVADCQALGGKVATPIIPAPAPAPVEPPAPPAIPPYPPVPNLPAPLPAFYEDWWNALQQRERALEKWIEEHLHL